MRLTKRKIRELIREALAEADMLAVDPDAERKESLDAIEYHLAAAKSNLASAEKAMHGDESGMIKDDYKLDIMDVIDGLEVLVDELEAQKARALGESRTRRNPYPRMRNPKGQKHRLDPHVRPGARPPDTWADIQPGRETFQWWKAVERMMGRFSSEEIVDRVVRKWGVSHAEVEAAMESIAQRRGLD
jgi:hypothetical protein